MPFLIHKHVKRYGQSEIIHYVEAELVELLCYIDWLTRSGCKVLLKLRGVLEDYADGWLRLFCNGKPTATSPIDTWRTFCAKPAIPYPSQQVVLWLVACSVKPDLGFQ